MKQILICLALVYLSACSFSEANRGSGRKTATLIIAQQQTEKPSQPQRGDGRRE